MGLRGEHVRTADNGATGNPLASVSQAINLYFMCVHPLVPNTAIQCSELTDPVNGSVSVSDRTPGSVASYSCRPGFVLEGVTLRTCQTTGVWSFEAPVCVGESMENSSSSYTHFPTKIRFCFLISTSYILTCGAL